MVDEYRDVAVAVSSDRAAEIWRLPIFTVSLSEGGFERVYQGTTIVHRFQLQLTSEPVAISFTVRAGALKQVLQQAFALVEMPG
jgi:alpha-amylase